MSRDKVLVRTVSTCFCVSVLVDLAVVIVNIVRTLIQNSAVTSCYLSVHICLIQFMFIIGIYHWSSVYSVCRSHSDVAFIVDASGSVGQENFRKQVEFLQELAMSLSVASNILIALETYSSDEIVYFHFSDFESKQNALNALSVPYLHGGTTNTAAALTTARRSIFSATFGDRPRNDDVVLLLTDGWSDRPGRTWQEAMDLRERGVHIIVVGIGSAVYDGELNGRIFIHLHNLK